MENFSEYGFQYPDSLIMTYIGGSQAHGAKGGGLAQAGKPHKVYL